jgi:hypothetical protein
VNPGGLTAPIVEAKYGDAFNDGGRARLVIHRASGLRDDEPEPNRVGADGGRIVTHGALPLGG